MSHKGVQNPVKVQIHKIYDMGSDRQKVRNKQRTYQKIPPFKSTKRI